MFINISISEEGKKMAYEDFVRLHKHHYRSISDHEMKSDYTELTGNVIKRKTNKGNKKAGQSGSSSDGDNPKSGSS